MNKQMEGIEKYFDDPDEAMDPGPVTVSMLADALAYLVMEGEGDKVVVLSSDPDGESFSPLSHWEDGFGWQDTPGGDLVDLNDDPSEMEDEEMASSLPSLVLYPLR